MPLNDYNNLSCPWCFIKDSMAWISRYDTIMAYRCKICNKTITIKDNGEELVRVTFNS